MRVLGQDIEGMGHVREAEGEVPVAGDVQGHAPLPVNMRGLPNAFGGQAPRRVASDLPAGHTLEMDGRPHDDADGGRLEEVPSSCKRRYDESGGWSCAPQQYNRSRVPVSDRRSDLSVRVRG
mgnify:CR=1 FL=1